MTPPPPRVRFLIGGVQKGGTTALARYLAAHPALRLPVAKEAHVFDMPGFDDRWDVGTIDRLYAPHFPGPDSHALHGDATPIYITHPRLIGRIARYNPAMRWIVLLRDPVERAISQYHMERARGHERWPMLAAFLLERVRLAGHRDDFSDASPLRTFSYLWRGDYARQLDALYRNFPTSQVLLIRSRALRDEPLRVLAAICGFLGVEPLTADVDTRPAFEGMYASPGPVTQAITRLLLLRARRRLARRYGLRFPAQSPSA